MGAMLESSVLKPGYTYPYTYANTGAIQHVTHDLYSVTYYVYDVLYAI